MTNTGGTVGEHMKDLLKASEEVLAWVRDCPSCYGVGREPLNPQDACYRCGGYGEEVYGDIMDAVLGLRAALTKAGAK